MTGIWSGSRKYDRKIAQAGFSQMVINDKGVADLRNYFLLFLVEITVCYWSKQVFKAFLVQVKIWNLRIFRQWGLHWIRQWYDRENTQTMETWEWKRRWKWLKYQRDEQCLVLSKDWNTWWITIPLVTVVMMNNALYWVRIETWCLLQLPSLFLRWTMPCIE